MMVFFARELCKKLKLHCTAADDGAEAKPQNALDIGSD
jgi:hypothetical protein